MDKNRKHPLLDAYTTALIGIGILGGGLVVGILAMSVINGKL